MAYWLSLILALTPGIALAQQDSAPASPSGFPALVARAQRQKDLARREALLREALKGAQQSGHLRQQGMAWQLLGRVCLADGNYRCALDRYQRAAQFFRRARTPAPLALLNSEFGLLLYEHGKYTEAQELLASAVAVHRENPDRRPLALALPGLALVNAKLGHREEARRNIEESRTLTPMPQAVGYAAALIGNAYVELGDYGKAVEILERPRRLRQPLPYLAYAGLAKAYFHLGRDPELLDTVATCLDRSNFNAGQEIGRRQYDCVYWRARALHRKGDLNGALQNIETGLAALEAMRSHLIGADMMKRDFDSSRREIADLAIEILFARKRYGEALQVAEQWRARAFLDLLATQEDPAGATQPPRVRNPRLRQVLHIAKEPPLASNGRTAPATLNDVVSTAQRLQTVVLSYWTTPTGVYLWTVTGSADVQGAFSAIALADLEALIGKAQSWKAAPDRAAWRRLHDLLIAPMQPYLPKETGALLTLVPHGPLLNLSFAALTDRSGRYLLERYTLHYTPTAALLDFTRRDTPPHPLTVLAVGNPRKPALADGKPLAELAGSRQELAAIATAIPVSRLTRLEAAEAVPVGIKPAVGKFDVLHFATHSVIDGEEPFSSFLALSGGLRLTAGEIYALEASPSLVVLSSCRSANGPVSADGVLGLTRAFFYAGAASIIASAWEVPDQTAPRLTGAFYRALERGQAKSKALRTAQLALLQDLRAGRVTAQTAAGPAALEEHPLLWAGFLLQGEP